VTIEVTFTVTQIPIIALTPAYLLFIQEAQIDTVENQTVVVTNVGTGTLDGLAVGTAVYRGGSPGWGTITLAGTTAPATITVAVDVGTTPAGTYRAEVPITSTASGVQNSPQTLLVDFEVPAWREPRKPVREDVVAPWQTTGEHDDVEERFVGLDVALIPGGGSAFRYAPDTGVLKVVTETDATTWTDATTSGTPTWD
jgi:hypothetical protein